MRWRDFEEVLCARNTTEIVTRVISFLREKSSIVPADPPSSHPGALSPPSPGRPCLTDKRLLRRALTLGAFIASVSVPGTLSAQQRHGDVNRDGVVSALDAQAILTQVVGLPIPPAYVIADGDSNCDQTTGALDAQIVLSYVIGLPVGQYCVGQSFGTGSTVVNITPTNDTSLLVNQRIRLRAVLTDANGFLIERRVTWTSSNADLVTIDSARGDTAWVSNRFATTGAADASATITAFADGAQGSRVIRVHRSYAGIVITPQRPDTLRQLNGLTGFSVRVRDSLGVLGAFQNAFWTTGDPNIATVPATAASSQNVTALTMGNTYLYVTSQANPAVRDSVPLTVRLPAQNSCTGVGGTLYNSRTYTTPQTWGPATNPHYLYGSVTFAAGSRLTIEPGTLICTQGGGFLAFNTGARLTAIGTSASPIVFKPTDPSGSWSGIQLGEFATVGATPPADTSVLTNVVVERAANGNGAVQGRERHVVLMDSVVVRQSWSDGVTLVTAGSRMIRSRIDTLLSVSAFNHAINLYRASLEETSIRPGGIGSGIQLLEAATVRQVNVTGGSVGIRQPCCSDSARINDVTITGTQQVALQLEGGLIHPLSANVAITGGIAGGFRGQIGNLGHLFADSLSQETLKNNGRDTVFITGGALVGVTQVVRPDLPWVVSASLTIDTLAVLAPRPGARVLFENSAMLWFQRGGRLTAAGEPAKFIAFAPHNGSGFGGLRFDSPGAGPNPALAPTVLSTMAYVRVDSASGQGVNEGVCCFSSAIAGATRHRLELDSVIVRKAHNSAVLLNARRSFMRRSLIDTTGNIGSNYTTAQPALVLNDSARVENSLIARSGQNGIYVPGAGARLTSVRVVDSRGVALQADGGLLDSTSAGVRLDSANASPFHGRIENLGIVAGTAALQSANLLGNTDNRVQITGGSLTRDTVEAIPALRWVVQSTTTIDTLGRLVAQPGADISFMNSAMLWFQRGGHLNATGTPASFVRFRPTGPGEAFGGLRFDSPGAGPNPALAPTALSTMTYVRVDSASGQGVNEGVCCFSSAIAGATRHRLELDSVIVHKAFNTAVSLNARRSFLRRSWIDTTGNVASNWVTTQPAVVLNDSARVENSLIARSGQNGIYAPGTGARLTNVRVTDSEGVGLQADGGVIDSTSVGVRLDLNAYPFHGRIENFGVVAGTSALQTANLLGNTDNKVHITGGALTRDTVDAIPALRWVVQATTTIDTLARLAAQAGADVTFMNGAMLWFQRGGHLNATGTPASFVRFRPTGPGEGFGGLRFDSPGAGPNPALAPTTLSTMTYVRVDSASGQGVNEGICCFTSTIAGAARHRLELDSIIVHKAFNAAVTLSAKHSFLRRSLIDTTGTVGTNYVSGQPAVVLGDSTSVESSLILRSGQNGIYAPGLHARLSDVRIAVSRGVALQLDQNNLHPASSNVRADSLNGTPFFGRVQNLGLLAPSAGEQQALFGGNIDSLITLTGGTLLGDTLQASRFFDWRLNAEIAIGTGAQFVPLAGARLRLESGASLRFFGGATMIAQGTSADSIYFSPVAGNASFGGLRFDGTTLVDFPSVMAFVRIDSAGGIGNETCCTSAAINASASHVLSVSNSLVRRSTNGAIHLRASGSSISDVVVDTTGGGPSFTTGQNAIGVNGGVSISNLLVRRSGAVSGAGGVTVDGTGVTLTGVRIVDASGNGLLVGSTSTGLQLTGFVVDSTQTTLAGTAAVLITANGIQMTGCDVLNSMGTGIATDRSLTGVAIHDCNILNNGRNGTALGISNANTTTPANVISAEDNFWGLDVLGAFITPSVGTPNGISANVNASPVRPSQRIP